MYRGSQQKRDWIERVGSYADRPVLHASMSPRAFAKFEDGLLAQLRDEKQRLHRRISDGLDGKTRCNINYRLAVINKEIKRLNREASVASEVALMWRAIDEVFDGEQRRLFQDRVMELRMMAEGHTQEEIASAIEARRAETAKTGSVHESAPGRPPPAIIGAKP